MKKNYFINYLPLLIAVFVVYSCGKSKSGNESPKDTTQVKETVKVESTTQPQVVIEPVDIERSFIPCGWMGDGEYGKRYIIYEANCNESPHSSPACLKISYKVGPKGFAGIYWMNYDCNWGDNPGFDLSTRGLTKISFWVKGESGDEFVQFKAGGVGWRGPSREYRDSFDYEPKLGVSLTTEWKQYIINLKGKDLSNVIGGFCWVANSDVTFYLDDIRFE